jgi:dihydrofolate reductase
MREAALTRERARAGWEGSMGKLVVTEFISLDGVIEDPGGVEDFEHGGWTFEFDRGDDGDAFKFEELMAADAQLLGRLTYDGFAKAWPSMEGEDEFTGKMNRMPKHVVSTTLESPTWNNTTVIADHVADEVAGLKKRYDGDVLIAGSGQLIRSLMSDGLIDEFRLMVFPVVLGSGKKLFDGAARTRLRLVDTKRWAPRACRS